jgi:hypothetical protein
MQTLSTQNRILYTDKVFKSPDDELLLSDLKLKEIPVLTDEEVIELKKILKICQPQIHDYFNFAKSLWTVVFDSITVKTKKNKSNIKNKSNPQVMETVTILRRLIIKLSKRLGA